MLNHLCRRSRDPKSPCKVIAGTGRDHTKSYLLKMRHSVDDFICSPITTYHDKLYVIRPAFTDVMCQ